MSERPKGNDERRLNLLQEGQLAFRTAVLGLEIVTPCRTDLSANYPTILPFQRQSPTLKRLAAGG